MVRLVLSNIFKRYSNLSTDSSFVVHVCYLICVSCLSLSYCLVCSLQVTCWEKADMLAVLCMMFSCVFVIFHYGVLGVVRYLIASIIDICLRGNYLRFHLLRFGIL